MWHRVDYDDGGDGGDESALTKTTAALDDDDGKKLSIGASIFHFYPLQYITIYPLFSFLIVPNLIQEVMGFNME